MKTRTRSLKLAALLILLIAVPASASHRFEDIPEGSREAPVTQRLYEHGITNGCDQSPPRFCPNENLERWEMALFLDRIAGRSASASSTSTFAPAKSGGGLGATIVTVEAPSGGLSGREGYMVLDGAVTVAVTGGCPCEVEAFLYRVSDGRKVGTSIYETMPSGNADVALPLTGRIQQAGDRSTTYAIGVFINGGSPTGATGTGTITADWTPYDE